MTYPRRFLPATPLLAAFEATARTGSVTAAAEELDLTQSAVSRQIRALEDQLRVALFDRDGRRMRLTPAGGRYLAEIRRALGLPNLSMDTVTVASGHVRVDSINVGRRTPLMITLVREPVDRLVSEYFFTRDRVDVATRAPGNEKKKRAATMSFEDYAEMLMERRDELPINGQCEYFSRGGGFAAARKVIDDRFLLAGPTERMPRFAELLGAKLGIPLGETRRENRGKSRPPAFEVPARLRSRLEEALSEDCALYDHVRTEFAALSDRVG